MSDREDNTDDVVESDEEEEETGMKSAYSIDDLAELDHDDEMPGDDNDRDEEGRTFGNSSSSSCRNQLEDLARCNDYLNDLDETRTNEDNNQLTSNRSDHNSDDVYQNDEVIVSDGFDSFGHGFTDRSVHGIGNDSGGMNGGGGDADDEEIYPTSAEVREKKRESLIEDSDGSKAAKVICDISGRFFSDGKGLTEEGLDTRPEHHYDSVYDELGVEGEDAERGGTLVAGQQSDDLSKDVYENVEPINDQTLDDGTNLGDDGGWASSEFEDYDDLGEQSHSQQSAGQSQESLDQGKVNPALDTTRSSAKIFKKGKLDRLSWRKTRLSTQTSEIPPVTSTNSASTMFDKLTAKISQKKKHESDEDADDESCMLEVLLNVSKHPPAQLPPPPPGLTALQMKRRHIVSVIVDSERSYASSLFRIVEDYEKPLLEAKPQILGREVVRTIFYKVREILQCHNMFQIELSEIVKVWDAEEKIGDVFTASFSKSIVFEVYSAFVNNFSVAMETAKKQARTKAAFAEFLKLKLETSDDRLSLFGLMVKPVQRFPQFIMLLQDILKFTPKDHHDRLALQLALTELDTLTDRLNETKRETDGRLEVKRLLTNLTGRYAFKVDSDCYLVRQDNVVEIKQKNGDTQTKQRRLFLINDQIICTDVIKRNSDSMIGEKYGFVWSIPVKDVELVDSSLPSSYKVHTTPGKTTVSGQQSETSVIPGDQNPFKKELDHMIHDLTLFESMLQLSGQLRLKYETFNVESLHGLMRYLQLMIGRRCDSEHCLITLSLPTKALSVSTEKQLKEQVVKQIGKVGRSKNVVDPEVRGNARIQVLLQFETSIAKQEWLLELQNTKLVTDPCFHPAWYVAENDQQPTSKHPYFHHPILLDITKDDVKNLLKSKTPNKDMVQCATFVTLPSIDAIDLGIQHLWVCNGDLMKGQVSIVSLHSNVPCVVESFRVCDNLICSAESVPSVAGAIDSIYGETVWMSTDDKKIIVCNVVEIDRSSKRQTINTESVVTCLKYHNGRMFAGTRNGHLNIFTYHDSRWNLKNPSTLNLSSMRISCLLPINKEMWVSSNLTIHVLTISSSKSRPGQLNIEKVCHELSSDFGQIECMVKAGVGLMVSFGSRAVIRLYHLETFQNLQDINIASAITPLLDGKQLVSPFNEDRKLFSLSITCMLSGKGLLWVGTNYGFILTLPLPRLEGVPQVKRRPTVSFHAHGGPVKFLAVTHCGGGPKAPTSSVTARNSMSSARPEDDDRVLAHRKEEAPAAASGSEELTRSSEDAPKEENALNSLQKSQWISTPELYNCTDAEESDSDISSLYGSLLKSVDADMDAGLTQPPAKRRPLRGLTFHNAVTTKVSKLSHAVRKNLKSSGHHNRTDEKGNVSSSAVTSPTTTTENLGLRGSIEEPEPNVVVSGVASPSLSREESTESYDGRSSVERDSEVGARCVPDCVGTRRGITNGTSECRISEQANSIVPPMTQMSPSSSCLTPVAVSPSRSRSSTNKRLIVVSGGEGHVNWKDTKPFNKSYEDICLLLWKY